MGLCIDNITQMRYTIWEKNAVMGYKGATGRERKTILLRLLSKMGMDSAALFKIGEQNAQCYGGYVYHCPTRLRGPSHRFVVNYIEEQGLYVAWSLDTPGNEKKTVFRVLKKELEHLSAGEVHAVFKTTHSGDRQKETVYVFDQAAVMRFLQMVREKMTR